MALVHHFKPWLIIQSKMISSSLFISICSNTWLWVLMTCLKVYEGWFPFERLVHIDFHDFSLKYEGKKRESRVLHFLPFVFQILVSFLFWIFEESRTLSSEYVTLSSQNSRKYVRKMHAINYCNFVYTHVYIHISIMTNN